MDLKRIQSGGASKEHIAQMIKRLRDESLSHFSKAERKEETKDRIEILMKQKKTETQAQSLSILVGFRCCDRNLQDSLVNKVKKL